MKLLEEKILSDGTILPGGILKIDNFLNHQIDTGLVHEMAVEFKRLYAGESINKILTIEASGIAIATLTGYELNCPVLFAKKTKSRNISDNIISAEVESFTHGVTNTILVSSEYLSSSDNVLLIDDFLATGAAIVGLKSLCDQAGAHVVGAGIAVEKVFQGGGNLLRARGLRIESLAKISSMTDDSIEFE